MKNIRSFTSLVLLLFLVTMSGCELLGDVMEFTMWTTLIVVAVVIAVIMWIVRKLRGPRRPRI